MKTIKKMKPAIIIAAIILLFASCSRESQPDNPKIMVSLWMTWG
jgi:PBP1b-binding outer membrane lipoprotein LpoB